MKVRNHILLGILCGLLVLACAACGQAPAPETSGSVPVSPSSEASAPESGSPQPVAGVLPGVNAENYPRVDGSTANLPLIASLYGSVCGVSPEEGEAFADARGTADAWLALTEGDAALLLVYEAPQSVQATLEKSGVPLEIQPLGRDGLVFLVNAQNPVNGLTREQLRDIYSGKVTDWSAVGGTAGAISPFQRNEDSGSQTMFLKLLMEDTAPMKPPTELVSGAMGSLIDSVAQYDGSGGAIGYSVYYYVQEMYGNPDLKILDVDGVTPSPQSIGEGSYPLVNEFFVAIRADEPEDSPARLLRDWLLTDAGAALLTQAGYVGIG